MTGGRQSQDQEHSATLTLECFDDQPAFTVWSEPKGTEYRLNPVPGEERPEADWGEHVTNDEYNNR
jgi:hypothetical protein